MTLTSHASVASADGMVGDAAKFTRSSSMYLSHADATELDLNDTSSASAWSIAVWGYCDSFPEPMYLLAKGNPAVSDGYKEYAIYVDVFGDVHAEAEYGSGLYTATWRAGLIAGEWFFVAVVANTSGEDAGLTIFGGKAATPILEKNVRKFTPDTADDKTGVFTIGNLWGNQSYLDGRIDELGLWKRALSDDEVDQIFNLGEGITYPFTEAAGQDLDWVSKPAIVTRPSIRTVPAEYPLPPLGDLVTGARVGGTPTVDSWRSETEVPVLPRPSYSNVYATPVINNRELVIPPVDSWWSNAEIPTPSKPGHLEAMAVPAVGPTAISEVNVPAVVDPPEEYTPARTEEADEYRSRNG
jgi:hypothetical protein